MSAWARRLLGERGILWAIALDSPPPQVEARVPVRFAEITDAEPSLARAMNLPDTDEIKARLARGVRGYAAWAGKDVAGYCWVSLQPEYIGEQERTLKLARGEAYIWDCAVRPAQRGNHIYSALLSFIVAQLRGLGVRRAWIGTAISNTASQRGFRNAGFQPVLALTYARLGNLRVMWYEPQMTAPRALVHAAEHALGADDEKRIGPFAVRWKQAN
jgi:ribosomal protein S18 acetylase RimI-like enzyme